MQACGMCGMCASYNCASLSLQEEWLPARASKPNKAERGAAAAARAGV
jgi:hypothetical protein